MKMMVVMVVMVVIAVAVVPSVHIWNDCLFCPCA